MSSPYLSPTLRKQIAEKSHYRCVYCLTSQHIIGPLLEIDHIIPQAKGGQHNIENLCLACSICNSHKLDHIEAVDPQTKATVRLFHPYQQIWSEHFEWQNHGTVINGKTATGQATINLLQMNHPDMVLARQLWVTVGWHPPKDLV